MRNLYRYLSELEPMVVITGVIYSTMVILVAMILSALWGCDSVSPLAASPLTDSPTAISGETLSPISPSPLVACRDNKTSYIYQLSGGATSLVRSNACQAQGGYVSFSPAGIYDRKGCNFGYLTPACNFGNINLGNKFVRKVVTFKLCNVLIEGEPICETS